MNDIFETRYMGKFYDPVDCNNCANLNITEFEQRERIKNGYHICTHYRERLKHRSSRTPHDPFIYPCDQCYKDLHGNYSPRKSNNTELNVDEALCGLSLEELEALMKIVKERGIDFAVNLTKSELRAFMKGEIKCS